MMQRGPAHAVDMIERRLGIDQRPDDLHMAEMRGRDQRRAIQRAGDLRALGAAVERDLEHLDIVLDRCDGQDVEALHVARIGIGAAARSSARRRVMLAVCGDEQRRAAVSILDVRFSPSADELLDLGHLAIGGGGVQAGVDRDVAIGGSLRACSAIGRASQRRETPQQNRQANSWISIHVHPWRTGYRPWPGLVARVPRS